MVYWFTQCDNHNYNTNSPQLQLFLILLPGHQFRRPKSQLSAALFQQKHQVFGSSTAEVEPPLPNIHLNTNKNGRDTYILKDNIRGGRFCSERQLTVSITSHNSNHHAMPASKKKMPGKFMKSSSSADLQPAWLLTSVMMRHAVQGGRNLLQRRAKYRKNKGNTTRIVRL